MMRPCKQGHLGRHSYIDKRGSRVCRLCAREKSRVRYDRDLRSLQTGHLVIASRNR